MSHQKQNKTGDTHIWASRRKLKKSAQWVINPICCQLSSFYHVLVQLKVAEVGWRGGANFLIRTEGPVSFVARKTTNLTKVVLDSSKVSVACLLMQKCFRQKKPNDTRSKLDTEGVKMICIIIRKNHQLKLPCMKKCRNVLDDLIVLILIYTISFEIDIFWMKMLALHCIVDNSSEGSWRWRSPHVCYGWSVLPRPILSRSEFFLTEDSFEICLLVFGILERIRLDSD